MTSAPTLAPVADPVQPRVAPPPYRMRRVLVVVLVVLAVLIPYGVTLALLWSDLSTRLTVAERERDGVTYLAPLVRVLSATADVQSVTVAGARPDTTEIRAAIGAVDVMDNRLGAELGTQERWADVSNRLDALLQAPPAGQTAYTSFTQVVDLETGLITAVGESSDLILDPQLDSFYVIDATLVRVPAILVSAGRANDLVRLGPPAALAPGIAVAADDVRTESAAIDAGFRKSFAVTQTGVLGPGLVSALDRLGDAVTALVPPTAGVGTVADRSARVLAARARVRDASLALETAALAQLGQALDARIDGLVAQRRLVLEAAAVGGLLAVIALVLAMPRSRRRPEEVAAVPWPGEPGAGLPPPGADQQRADRTPFDDRGGGRTRATPPPEMSREQR